MHTCSTTFESALSYPGETNPYLHHSQTLTSLSTWISFAFFSVISKLSLAHTNYLYNELLNFLDDVFLLPGHWIKELSYSWTNTNTSSSTCNCFLTCRLVNTRWQYNTLHSPVKVPTTFPLVKLAQSPKRDKHYAMNTCCQHKDAFARFCKGSMAVWNLLLQTRLACLCLPRAGVKGMRHHCPDQNHYFLNMRIWSASTVSLLFSLSQITIQRFLHVFLSITIPSRLEILLPDDGFIKPWLA